MAFEDVKKEATYNVGEVADYIPTLKKANPSWFANAFCSVDGQFTKHGDHKVKFSMQSVSKVVAYA